MLALSHLSSPQAFFSINPASTITIKGIFAYSHVRNRDSATASTSVKVVNCLKWHLTVSYTLCTSAELNGLF